MHPELLVRALAAMEGQTTHEKFHMDSGIASRSIANEVIGFMRDMGIGTSSGRALAFSGRDRLQAAVIALQSRCDVEQVSEHLSWKDFECLASEVLSSLGYSTRTNVRFTKPRMEIDVVGVDAGFCLAVDCKHWKRGNLSAIAQFCEKQAARAEEIVRRDRKISAAVPAILTLHAERVRFVAGIPVIPVMQFRSFAMDVKGFLGEMRVVRQGPAPRQRRQK
ncbi:MAG: hypothetical protein ACREAY_11895 [Nitrososphaera sp.]|uniref:hypothetical protein n=1 Tax=Nitrososphaera sp. TaxID=1971748 RepID=UPI003D6EE5FC